MPDGTYRVSIDPSGAKRGSKEAVRSFDNIKNAARRLNRDGLKRTGDAFSKLRRSVFNLKSAIAGVGIGLLTREFVQAASITEQYQVRLEALTGSVEAAQSVFQDMTKFAGEVPFAYKDIMDSATSLAGVITGGSEELNKFMPIIADLAAVSGLSIQDTTSQVIRMYSAGAASADMFRERGILAMLGFQAGVSVSAEETRKRLIEAWEDAESKFRGVTERLAETWTGILSMLGDRWFMFRNRVMESGAFDALKDRANEFLQAIDDAMASGRMDVWAQNLSRIFEFGIDGMVALGKSIGATFNFFARHISTIRIAWTSWVAAIMESWETVKFGAEATWLVLSTGWETVVRGMQTLWINFLTAMSNALINSPIGKVSEMGFALADQAIKLSAARGEATNLGEELLILGQKYTSTIAGIQAMKDETVAAAVAQDQLRIRLEETPDAATWQAQQQEEGGEDLTQAQIDKRIQQIQEANELEQQMMLEHNNALIEGAMAVHEAKVRIAELNKQLVIDSAGILLNLFAKDKELAIGKALISTYQGAAQALKDVPYPWNIGAAGLVIAEGMRQVQRIKSTGVRGGGRGGGRGAAPSLAGAGAGGGVGTPETPEGGAAQGGQQINFVINALDPETVDPGKIKDMLRRSLPEVIKDGAGVVGDIEIPHIQR